jgi:peptidoglycan hydrolase-like protein with peptidoglycan-binding domain
VVPAVPAAPAPAAAEQHTQLSYDGSVKYKSRGPAVSALQQRLLELGYFKDQVTGYFGSITETALANFQRDHKLESNGYPNRDTIDALNQCDQSCARDAGQG